MKNHKFYFTCNAQALLLSLSEWNTIRMATVGVLKGDTPKIVMIGSIDGVDENIIASVDFDWTKHKNIPAYTETVCMARPLDKKRGSGFEMFISSHRELQYADKESEVIRSVERLEDSFPTYRREIGDTFNKHGNDKETESDLAFVVKDILNESLADLVLTPYQSACSLVELKDSENVLYELAERLVAQTCKNGILEVFDETIGLIVESAKHALVCTYNGLNAMSYFVSVLLEGKDLSHTMKSEYDNPIEQMEEALKKFGVGSSWVSHFEPVEFADSISDLLGMLPNVGKEDIRIFYNGLDAYVKREKARIEDLDMVLHMSTETFCGFSLN